MHREYKRRARVEALSVETPALSYVDMPLLPCPHCRSTKRLIMDLLQTRSPDEPATEFFTCENGCKSSR